MSLHTNDVLKYQCTSYMLVELQSILLANPEATPPLMLRFS